MRKQVFRLLRSLKSCESKRSQAFSLLRMLKSCESKRSQAFSLLRMLKWSSFQLGELVTCVQNMCVHYVYGSAWEFHRGPTIYLWDLGVVSCESFFALHAKLVSFRLRGPGTCVQIPLFSRMMKKGENRRGPTNS